MSCEELHRKLLYIARELSWECNRVMCFKGHALSRKREKNQLILYLFYKSSMHITISSITTTKNLQDWNNFLKLLIKANESKK